MIKQDTFEKQAKFVYLGIGSNLGNRISNIENAKIMLSDENVKIIQTSNYYETPSWPDPNKPKFYNIVLKIKTNLDLIDLLNLCKNIEKSLGRKKTPKNSPRECDIDILDYNNRFDDKGINVPHPKMHKRNFVLFPLKEINPQWIHPKLNKKIDFFINNLSQIARNEITRKKESVILD